MNSLKDTEQLPDLRGCASTKEKAFAFLNHIDDTKRLDRIYRFVKYLYFYGGIK